MIRQLSNYWNSYWNYTIWYDLPDNIPILSLSREFVDKKLSLIKNIKNYKPPSISKEEIYSFLSYFQVLKFLEEIKVYQVVTHNNSCKCNNYNSTHNNT